MAKKPTISFAILSSSFLLLLVSLSDARSASDLLFKVDLTEVSHPDGKILLPTEKLPESSKSVPSSSTAALDLEEDKHPLATHDVPDRFDGPGEKEDHEAEERSHDGNVLTVRYRPMKMRLEQPWMVRRFFHSRFRHGQHLHPFETSHHHHHHHHHGEDGLFDDKEQGDTITTSSNLGKVEEHHHHANRLPEFDRVGILASNDVDLMFGEPHHYRHHHHHFFHHHDDDHHLHHHDHDDDHHFHHHDDDHMMMRRKRFGVWKRFQKLLTHF